MSFLLKITDSRKDKKQILGQIQLQTLKLLAWQYQEALNIISMHIQGDTLICQRKVKKYQK